MSMWYLESHLKVNPDLNGPMPPLEALARMMVLAARRGGPERRWRRRLRPGLRPCLGPGLGPGLGRARR